MRCNRILFYEYAMRCLIVIASKEEHPKRYDRWLNELESLGISAKRINELNDLNEISSLADNIKRGFYQEYEGLLLLRERRAG
ncbi:MAG: hypothetical protein WA220_08060, partial [Candidatus Nitrosopolaris sp.]